MALIPTHINNKKYHSFTIDLLNIDINKAIMEAPIPNGRQTINDPSVNSISKNKIAITIHA